jgi:cytochrome-b5 reductase
MTKDMIKEHMPAPGPDTLILFCGPPVFTDMLSTVLKELGYTADMVFKF